MARLAWKDEFNLNVDYIDNAELNRIYAHRLPDIVMTVYRYVLITVTFLWEI